MSKEDDYDKLLAELNGLAKTERDRAIALEAVRAKRRLDQLAKVTEGDGATWMTITVNDKNSRVIKIDSAVREARQLALTLKTLLEHFDSLYEQQAQAEEEEYDILKGL